jgi:ABC-type antimicrobial peptide transport system permease subunit
VPQGTTILLFVVLIVAITVLTAWLPARKAAKLPPATALRHYD